jgi:hypothetical protein
VSTPRPSDTGDLPAGWSSISRRRLIAGALLTAPAMAFGFRRRQPTNDSSPPDDSNDLFAVVSAPPALAVSTTTLVTARSDAASLELTRPLERGVTGADVSAIQQRLRALSFDPGPVDGLFGPATEQAVWAFEKFILHVAPEVVTGVVTPTTWEAMSVPIGVRPRRANRGTHMEILLPEQVAVVYVDNAPTLITHVSSGSGETWCDVVLVDHDDGTTAEEGICGVATTPGGVFHFERRVVGWRNSKLGRLYNPVYFNYGIAVHGASNVPSYPASHGCVRIPMHIADYFPSLVANGDLVYVFDGEKEPEEYGAQPPIFDYPDPNFVRPEAATTTTEMPTATTTAA